MTSLRIHPPFRLTAVGDAQKAGYFLNILYYLIVSLTGVENQGG